MNRSDGLFKLKISIPTKFFAYRHQKLTKPQKSSVESRRNLNNFKGFDSLIDFIVLDFVKKHQDPVNVFRLGNDSSVEFLQNQYTPKWSELEW